MPVFIALLRGVNVGGNILGMDRLRELAAELGLKDAQSYVQSGNLVFSARGSAARWAQALEKKLNGEARLPVSVIVRTAAELEKVRTCNPFLRKKGVDRTRFYVTFLARAAALSKLGALDPLKVGAEEVLGLGKEIYLYCPNGYGKSKLSNNAVEKALDVRATTRNWNTVNKLCDMAAKQ